MKGPDRKSDLDEPTFPLAFVVAQAGAASPPAA